MMKTLQLNLNELNAEQLQCYLSLLKVAEVQAMNRRHKQARQERAQLPKEKVEVEQEQDETVSLDDNPFE